MSVAFGYNSWLGYGRESTFGTAVAATDFIELMEESIKGKKGKVAKSSLRGVSRFGRVEGKKSVAGSFSSQFFFNGLEKLFTESMGSVSTATVESGHYAHTFSLAKALPTGLTVVVNRDAASIGGSTMFRYKGCQVNKLTLAQKMEDMAILTCDIVGQDWDQAAIATPTFGGSALIAADYIQFAATLNGSAVAFEDFEFSLDNALNTDRYKLGSQIVKGLGRKGERVGSWKGTAEFESNTEYAYYLNQTSLALVFSWTSTAVLGTSVYSLVGTAPVTYLTGEDPGVKDKGPIKVALAGEIWAQSSPSSDNEFSLVLHNSVATA